MVAHSTQLYRRMQEQLQDIAMTAENLLQRSEQSARLAADTLLELKEQVNGYSFTDQTEEIRFFKEVKPAFLKEMLYHLKVYTIESQRPIGAADTLESYYTAHLHQLSAFFDRNRFLYVYYRSGRSHLDPLLYVRNAPGIPMLYEYSPDADLAFANPYSYKLAKLQAYEEVTAHLRALLLSHKKGGQEEDDKTEKNLLTWTASKADLIELAYGLQSIGAFNNGKADVKHVMDWLQHCFDIKVANFYGYFQSMRIRKKNRTPFLDKLKEHVVRRMDESDEHPRYH